MKKLKGILALMLAVVLTVGIVPQPAQAASSNPPNTVIFIYDSRSYTIDGATRQVNTAPFGRGGYTYMDAAEIKSILGVTGEIFFDIPDQAGIIITDTGKTCIPIAALGEALGYSASYNERRKEVTFQKQNWTPPPQGSVVTTPSWTPAIGNPVQVNHEPQQNVSWGVGGNYWAVVTAWNPNVDNAWEYKYLVKLDKTSDVRWFGNGYGGSVWFFANETEARAAYDNNRNAPGRDQPSYSGSTSTTSPNGTPTTGSPIRADHAPNGAAWLIKSDYWAIANWHNPNENNGKEYKLLISPGEVNIGTNTGGAIWFFLTEREAREQYRANTLPIK